MASSFSISFDPESLSRIAQFAGFGVLLSDNVQNAMQEAGSLLVASVRGAMHWQNPGNDDLSNSIAVQTQSPYEILVGSDLPYARRRDWGFVGTDSLGRTYNDQGAFYMESGFDQAAPQASLLIESAAQATIDTMTA